MKLLLLIFLGASLGSFLGLVIDRFPDQSIVWKTINLAKTLQTDLNNLCPASFIYSYLT